MPQLGHVLDSSGNVSNDGDTYGNGLAKLGVGPGVNAASFEWPLLCCRVPVLHGGCGYSCSTAFNHITLYLIEYSWLWIRLWSRLIESCFGEAQQDKKNG